MKEKKAKCVSFNCKFISLYAFLLPILYIGIRYFHDEVFHLCKPKDSLKILKYNLPYLFYLFLPKIFYLFLF